MAAAERMKAAPRSSPSLTTLVNAEKRIFGSPRRARGESRPGKRTEGARAWSFSPWTRPYETVAGTTLKLALSGATYTVLGALRREGLPTPGRRYHHREHINPRYNDGTWSPSPLSDLPLLATFRYDAEHIEYISRGAASYPSGERQRRRRRRRCHNSARDRTEKVGEAREAGRETCRRVSSPTRRDTDWQRRIYLPACLPACLLAYPGFFDLA